MIPIGDHSRRGSFFAAAVYAIVAVNVYVFVQELQAPQIDRFIDAFATIPYDITHGIQLPAPSPHPPYLTVLTSMFLHGSYLHIVFNMLFLLVFGPAIEQYFGTTRFVLFYLTCGIIAAAAQIIAAPGSHVPQIGASGAIAGVLGAYIVTFPANMIQTVVPIGCLPLFFRLPAILVIGVWAVVQFVHGFGTIDPRTGSESGGIAYFAHIGGFLSGIFLAASFRPKTRIFR